MVKQRLLTAVGIAVIILAVLMLSGISWVMPVAAALMSVMGAYELLCISKQQDSLLLVWSCLIPAFWIPMVSVPYYIPILFLTLPLALVTFAVLMHRMEHIRLTHPITIFLLSVMIGLFYKAMAELRFLKYGFLYVGIALLVCVITDSAAYLFGRRFGRRKLASRVSPKKTLEGALGGTISAIVLMLMLGCLIELTNIGTVSFLRLNPWAILATVVAQFGDLSMSVLKRICGAKDFSNLFPGHGGILDRFDSFLFVVPYTLLFVHIFGGIFV